MYVHQKQMKFQPENLTGISIRIYCKSNKPNVLQTQISSIKTNLKRPTRSVSILLKTMLIIWVSIAFDVAWFIGDLLQIQTMNLSVIY